ncbi:FliG C-terminal domain-containing protein [Hyphomonas pacifica]|uniref:Flagellar motor switch protein FliG n=1 Tax=Hyphomonas pacifica TaxID=1280941 RepID=A0A062U6I4_9PROT|nr:FliG C-terminal domain-containing protein [Hyphomonas pacifica]KCZ52209.1 hypothetical protein HY2_09335 [Hyphomonas pacifica]RAN35063.1 hypothetical protein HY3_09465 [Hyphomonas pacifica]RAN37524.1 hypothetical protein HY11_08540 [Hyphomonas pacifica]
MSIALEQKQAVPRPAATNAIQPAGSARVTHLTRAQRAAVVIAVLGEAEARPIVEKLDDRTMSRVAAALETISVLDKQELAEIAMDFLKEMRAASGSFAGGQNKAREIIANVLDQGRYEQIYGLSNEADDADPESDDTWSRLERHDARQVATYFQTLTPNIIALLLRKLDVSVASEIIGFLDNELLDPVIGHLVEDEAPDQEIYSVLAHMVEMELLNNTEAETQDDTSHLEAVGEILSLIPGDKRDRVIAFLNNEHESKMRSIERVMFTIDSLPEILPRSIVPVVFRELGEDSMTQLLASLRNGGAGVSEYLLGNISSRLADQYRLQMEDIAQMSAEKAEKVQRQFLMSLMMLKRQGGISIGKTDEAEAV